MTREEKIAWLEKASNEQVIKQFEARVRDMEHLFEIKHRTIEEIQEDYELVKAEVLKRLSK